MSIVIHAQPYDITANGFYFSTADEYTEKAAALRNGFGDPVEEFEIQFIDGDDLDCALAKAIGLTQANIRDFLGCVEDWQDWQKTLVIIAIGECGYDFDPSTDPESYDIVVYHVGSYRELAEQFVVEGYLGDIPEHLQHYIDYDAIARDLEIDYGDAVIAGDFLIFSAA
ncbi:MAG: antirestriction protein ArdA [Alphaproteobacteria bacterium]